MSSTMVVTMAPTSTLHTETASCCPGCGFNLPPSGPSHSEDDLLDAQARITDLEAQVRLLNQKAAAAADRWADYEDELTRLRAQQLLHQKHLPEQPLPSPTASYLQAGTNRLSAMLAPRKSPVPTPTLMNTLQGTSLAPRPATAAGDPSHVDLRQALTREQGLRREAEGRLSQSSREMEELSATLFEQANEMVAEERRARARLEQRVGELEKRDFEKRRRLERLELAMARLDRARALLQET